MIAYTRPWCATSWMRLMGWLDTNHLCWSPAPNGIYRDDRDMVFIDNNSLLKFKQDFDL